MEKILKGSELHIGLIFNYKNIPHVITSGTYLGESGRVSNFWYFAPILENGILGETKFGYGGGEDFTENEDMYIIRYEKLPCVDVATIETRIRLHKNLNSFKNF